MKKTKTIEVEVCDLCGEEGYHLIICGQCKKEACMNCHSYVSVLVQHLKPWRRGNSRGCSSETLRKEYNRSFCGECGNKVIKELEKMGLIGSRESKEIEQGYAVMD